MATQYSKVSVPEPLFERLKEVVEENPELGYRSASEAAADSIRRRLEELEEIRGGTERESENESGNDSYEGE